MPKSVNIGKMRDRIRFDIQTKTADGQGGFTTTYAEEFTAWGSVRETGGDREMRTNQLAYNVAYEIIARYRNGDSAEPLNKYRIVYNGLNLTIHTILTNDESTVKIIAYSTGV